MKKILTAIVINSLCLSVALAQADQPIGKVVTVVGDLIGIDGAENSVELQNGAPIYLDQLLGLGENAKAQFLLNDGTLVSAAAASIFSIQEFSYNQDANDTLRLDIESGTLRVLSGDIDRKETPGIRVMTPEGVVEVLGTLLVVSVSPEGTRVGFFDGSGRAMTEEEVRALGIGADFNFAILSKDRPNFIEPLLGAPEELAAIEAVIPLGYEGIASQLTPLQISQPLKLLSLAEVSSLKFKLKIDRQLKERLMLKLRDRQVDLKKDGLKGGKKCCIIAP